MNKHYEGIIERFIDEYYQYLAKRDEAKARREAKEEEKWRGTATSSSQAPPAPSPLPFDFLTRERGGGAGEARSLGGGNIVCVFFRRGRKGRSPAPRGLSSLKRKKTASTTRAPSHGRRRGRRSGERKRPLAAKGEQSGGQKAGRPTREAPARESMIIRN